MSGPRRVNPGAPAVVLPVASNALGAADVLLPIPGAPALAGQSLFAQFVWFGPAAPPPCPILGVSASNALQITIQP